MSSKLGRALGSIDQLLRMIPSLNFVTPLKSGRHPPCNFPKVRKSISARPMYRVLPILFRYFNVQYRESRYRYCTDDRCRVLVLYRYSFLPACTEYRGTVPDWYRKFRYSTEKVPKLFGTVPRKYRKFRYSTEKVPKISVQYRESTGCDRMALGIILRKYRRR
jgi:hypothetical protein